MLAIKPLFLFATSACAVVTPTRRSVSSNLILSDLVALDTSVKVLTSSIQRYSGGVFEATPILAAITAVHLSNRKAYTDSRFISSQSLDDSQTLVSYVSNTLAKTIPACVDTLESKKKEFGNSGLNSIVVGSLKLLKNDHETLSAALTSKLDLAILLEASVAVAIIDDAIKGGIAYFST
ncbi:hydrophobic surface binding protein A-domain-containing protein [Tricladium varicosporioides]|nr:hydrophobic surface binding protein A-domain-containing protein [Hymenoscyphus varicosporioides]